MMMTGHIGIVQDSVVHSMASSIAPRAAQTVIQLFRVIEQYGLRKVAWCREQTCTRNACQQSNIT